MTVPKYPLLEVLQVKIRRVQDQEIVVNRKRENVENEKKKLAEREAARDKVLKHYHDKLWQLRNELDHDTDAETIKMMKVYIKEVSEKLKVEEKKVEEQKKVVEAAQKELDEAVAELKKRRQDVDKIETHREDWLKGVKKELQVIEGREEDELGQIIFSKNQRGNV